MIRNRKGSGIIYWEELNEIFYKEFPELKPKVSMLDRFFRFKLKGMFLNDKLKKSNGMKINIEFFNFTKPELGLNNLGRNILKYAAEIEEFMMQNKMTKKEIENAKFISTTTGYTFLESLELEIRMRERREKFMNIQIKRIRIQYYSHLEIWRLKITIGINGLNPCAYWLERIKFNIDYDHKSRKPGDEPMPIFGFMFYRKVNYLDIIISRLKFKIHLWKWEFSNDRNITKCK